MTQVGQRFCQFPIILGKPRYVYTNRTEYAHSRNQRQQKIIQEKIKKDNREKLAREELNSRDKHHKRDTGFLNALCHTTVVIIDLDKME